MPTLRKMRIGPGIGACIHYSLLEIASMSVTLRFTMMFCKGRLIVTSMSLGRHGHKSVLK